MSFETAQRVADTVLYEGYVLYPYRASSDKNRVRWQFGVVAPRAWAEADGSERWTMQTECLLEPENVPDVAAASISGATVDVRVRFLQLQRRTVQVPDATADDGAFRDVPEAEIDGRRLIAWDEASERTLDVEGVALDDLIGGTLATPFVTFASEAAETVASADGSIGARLIRRTEALEVVVLLRAERLDGAFRIRARVENRTPWANAAGASRDEAMRRSLAGTHILLEAHGGGFLSLIDPPTWAVGFAATCRQEGMWPVLVGEPGRREVMLASPIILYDYPEVAPESAGDLFDSTEIDEILTLRIMTLTDEEKAEARATDERARHVIDRSDSIPPEIFARLHGAIRSMGPVAPSAAEAAAANAATDTWTPDMTAWSPDAPIWEPEARVAPERASVFIDAVEVGKGHRVLLRPGPRGDSMDMFLAGRVGTVEGVFESVDDETYVAVTIEADPAAELHSWYGRYFYFRPTELEPLPAAEQRAS